MEAVLVVHDASVSSLGMVFLSLFFDDNLFVIMLS